MGSRDFEDWGQYFYEFYGIEYCQNLRKDLEKLKDEYYNGNKQKLLKEWVLPTLELLRRLREMNFPIRTRTHIVIHLYNPVDSMAPGELHFQVGRKNPGSLTLKFTKLSPLHLYIIQPKTLGIQEELNLCRNPLLFLEQLQLEMRMSALDTSNMLKVVVLMTDACHLERQSVTSLFVANPNEFYNSYNLPSWEALHSGTHQGKSIVVTSHKAVPTITQPSDIRAEMGSISVPSNTPVNVCFKNYVHYGAQDGFKGGGPRFLTPSLPVTDNNSVPYPIQRSGSFSAAPHRTFLQLEPEEDDETVSGPNVGIPKQVVTSKNISSEKIQGVAAQNYLNPSENVMDAKLMYDKHLNTGHTIAIEKGKMAVEVPLKYQQQSPVPDCLLNRRSSSSTTISKSSSDSLDADVNTSIKSSSSKTSIVDEYATNYSENYFSVPEDKPGRSGSFSEVQQHPLKYEAPVEANSSYQRAWSVDSYMGSDDGGVQTYTTKDVPFRIPVESHVTKNITVPLEINITGPRKNSLGTSMPRTSVMEEYAQESNNHVPERRNSNVTNGKDNMIGIRKNSFGAYQPVYEFSHHGKTSLNNYQASQNALHSMSQQRGLESVYRDHKIQPLNNFASYNVEGAVLQSDSESLNLCNSFYPSWTSHPDASLESNLLPLPLQEINRNIQRLQINACSQNI